MALHRYFFRLLEITLVVVVIALTLSAVFGQPVLLGYVETDSMAPTLQPNDGFVAVPAPVAGDVDSGDVVVFRAEYLHGGGIVTHRVVGKNEKGYITKGDANPVTDQSGSGEPPVANEQIVATVLQINGEVVVLPNLGVLVETSKETVETVQLLLAGMFGSRSFLGVQGLAFLLTGALLVIYLADLLRESSTRTKDRRKRRKRTGGMDPQFVVAVLTLFVVGSVTMGMVMPSQTHEFRVIKSGTETAELTVENGAFVPMTVYLVPGSDDITAQPTELHLDARSSRDATVKIAPPTGIHDLRRFLTEYRYFAILPPGVLRSLFGLHPWAPVVVIDTLVGVPFYLLGLAVLGKGRLRDRARNRDVPLSLRLQRTIRGLYR